MHQAEPQVWRAFLASIQWLMGFSNYSEMLQPDFLKQFAKSCSYKTLQTCKSGFNLKKEKRYGNTPSFSKTTVTKKLLFTLNF
jgi:hypothetical protein